MLKHMTVAGVQSWLAFGVTVIFGDFMNSFIEQSNFFEGNDPEKIAQEYGTPLYVYNEKILRTRMDAVSKVITK